MEHSRTGQFSVAQDRTPLTYTFTDYGDLRDLRTVWYVLVHLVSLTPHANLCIGLTSPATNF